jgi:hypothetical protein
MTAPMNHYPLKYYATMFVFFAGTLCQVSSGQTENRGQHKPSRPVLEVAALVRKSLVLVITQDHDSNAIGQGSGFFLKTDLVATNLHVLKWASQAFVKSSEGISYKISKVVGFDLKRDICVLKLAGARGVPLPLSTTDNIDVGDDILVAGNPEGLEASFSKGIVSGIRPGSGLIQMDASISPGSSGGPVVNLDGQVVAIAAASYRDGHNLNFAVPVRFLREQALLWDLSVEIVGGLAVRDWERDGFSGPVASFIEKHASYSFNRSRGSYIEGPALTYTASQYSRDGQLEEIAFFKEGAPNGKMRWEYTETGLIRRHVDIDADGRQRHAHEYSPEEAVATKAAGVPFDGTVGFGTRGDPYYQDYKYDNRGRLIERTFPQQGVKYVMKYDAHGREIESSEYRQGKLHSVTRSQYQDNEYGDWIKRHDTVWLASDPSTGFTPEMEQYREITYHFDSAIR